MSNTNNTWYSFPFSKPKRNTLCLCKVKHQPKAASDYRIAFYGEKQSCTVGKQFWLYDLIITNDVIEYMSLEYDYSYF